MMIGYVSFLMCSVLKRYVFQFLPINLYLKQSTVTQIYSGIPLKPGVNVVMSVMLAILLVIMKIIMNKHYIAVSQEAWHQVSLPNHRYTFHLVNLLHSVIFNSFRVIPNLSLNDSTSKEPLMHVALGMGSKILSYPIVLIIKSTTSSGISLPTINSAPKPGSNKPEERI